MGGARPKAVVQDSEGLWLAKFNRIDDKFNQSRVEHSMLVLAKLCGITTAHSKLTTVGGRDVLLVKRFDREKTAQGYLRARMVSGLTLLGATDSHRSREQWSYVLLAEELRRICTEPVKQTAELFRRMCFNALISNTDDHPRNHAAIAKDHEWKLSPAYDLTPTSPVSLERRDLALSIGDLGRYANAENILSQCERFAVEREQAKAIVTNMQKLVKNSWHDVMRAQGVSARDCELLRGAFAYPGFDMTSGYGT
ncbi:MAG: HipA domain-containing protein [Burkholderiaceae bacterium]|nr:HipA domain-containing protein [Burkholderiaceae bacterium]